MGSPFPTTTKEYAFEDGTRLLYQEWITLSSGLATLAASLQGQPLALYYAKIYPVSLPGAGTAEINIGITDGGQTFFTSLCSIVIAGSSQQILPAEWSSPRAPAGVLVQGGDRLALQNKYGGGDVTIRTLIAYRPMAAQRRG